jgi:hypothetical protein
MSLSKCGTDNTVARRKGQKDKQLSTKHYTQQHEPH